MSIPLEGRAPVWMPKVEELASALQRGDTPLQASEMLRGLIDWIVLIPDEGRLPIELRGNLAAMLTAAHKRKGRQKRATFSCRFNSLQGLATNTICSFGAQQLDSPRPGHYGALG